MKYFKNEYPNNIIIFDQDTNKVVCRLMHYDFNNEEEAIEQAEIIVNSLNKEEETEEVKISIRDFIQKYDVEKLEGLKVVGFDKPQTVRLTKNDIESLKELKPTQNIRLTTNRGNWIYSNDEVFYSEEEEIFYFEDWVNYMLGNSDYTPEEITDFKEHYQNLKSFEENTKNFIKYNEVEETKPNYTHAVFKDDAEETKYLIHEIIGNTVLLGQEEYPEIEQDFYTDIDLLNLIEVKDLFEHYEEQPEEVSSILKQYGDLEELDYEQCKELQKNLETIGYTFEFGLDAQPFNLRKI